MYGLNDWLRERLFRHSGNANFIRQEFASEHGVVLRVRHIGRRVARLCRELKARVIVRFEMLRPATADRLWRSRVWIEEGKLRVHLFVATLGLSRRMHLSALQREWQGTD
ncbi:hypothetical protein GCM10028812_52540 [Ancylobacter sonchi]